MAQIKLIAQQIFNVNNANGFWPEKRPESECRVLIASEGFEAFEAFRNGKKIDVKGYNAAYYNIATDINSLLDLLIEYFDKGLNDDFELFKYVHKTFVKDSLECELADVAIRCLDTLHGGTLGRIDYKEGVKNEHFDLYLEAAEIAYFNIGLNHWFYVECKNIDIFNFCIDTMRYGSQPLFIKGVYEILYQTFLYTSINFKFDFLKLINVVNKYNSLRGYKHGGKVC